VTVVTAPPSPPSSFVQTRRACGFTSRYLPKNALEFEATLRGVEYHFEQALCSRAHRAHSVCLARTSTVLERVGAAPDALRNEPPPPPGGSFLPWDRLRRGAGPGRGSRFS